VSSPRWTPPIPVERAFAAQFLAVAAVAWASLTLAEFNLFTRGRLIALAVPITLVGLVWIWRDHPRHPASDLVRPVSRWWVAALVLCLVAAGALSAHPEEPLIDGSDAAIYANVAAVIQHRGGLTVADPIVATLTEAQRAAFFERDPLWPHVYNLFPGGFQLAADDVHLGPNFFHLLPAAMAGLSALARSTHAALFVTPLAGVLAVLALWLLATRLSSPFAATTAAALLTVSCAHIWFSRVAVSEMLTECLVVSGLYFAARAAQERSGPSGAFAGAAFGLAAASRLEVLALVTPIVAACLALIAIRRRWTRATTWFAIVFVALTAQAGWHAWFVTTAYTQRILWRLFGTDWWFRATTLLVPAVIAGAALIVYAAWRRKTAIVVRPWIRACLSLVLLAAIVRSWPHFWSGSFALLVTPAGLVLMMCGAVWLVLDAAEIEAQLAVALFVASAIVYIDATLDTRFMPLAWRRVVPVVLPLGVWFMGHALDVLGRRSRPWRSIASAVVVALVVITAARSWPLAAASFRAGIYARVAAIDASLPAHAVVVADPSTPGQLALSLYGAFNRDVIAVRHNPSTEAALGALARSIDASGRPVVLAIAPHAVDGSLERQDFTGFDVMPIGTESVHWTRIAPSRTTFPSETRAMEVTVDLYKVAPRRAHALPVTIDIGPRDFGSRLDGFYDAEDVRGVGARWTAETADIELPRIGGAARARLILRIAAPRPTGEPPAATTVSIDGRVVGLAANLSPDFRDVALALDPAAVRRIEAGPTKLTLRTPPFVPADTAGTDTRRLGVMVDWLRLEVQ
jgi:hypothetical protein